jgi:YidC/Oxa1 family membrane protein insertase
MDDQNRNLLLATALSFLVILVWFFLFPPAPPEDVPPEGAEQAQPEDGLAPPAPERQAGTTPELAGPERTRAEALAQSERVRIATPRLTGSLSLAGGRIDDLKLADYHVTIDEDSPNVTLFSPAGAPGAYYALYGWTPAGATAPGALPGASTEWRVEEGSGPLGPSSPVTLVWDNGEGLIFRRVIEVDDEYMFTITQSVENTTGEPVRLAPYGIVARQGTPSNLKNFYILHEGVILMADGSLTELDYDDVAELEVAPNERAAAQVVEVASNGWIGFTDHYWMSTLAAPSGQGFAAVAKYTEATDTFQTDMRLPVLEVPPGGRGEASTYLFAGAKEWATIRDYQNNLGIERFVDAIDWGWFFFLTKPIFWVLHHINQLIGNMGWSIIGLTLVIKLVLFPLAYKSYVSMSKMKALQPEMEKIKERAGEDRMKLQQEMMALYKKEKVNPAAGCLPILLQIPIFFSLYKVIFVTIELRHAPFFGWIRDLSAPDPTSWINLFGLLPWDAPGSTSLVGIVSIGVWPILLGVSMWLQMKLNPAPTDKTQAMIFAWMPWIFMFMLGQFAAGLVIYWVANNVITFVQQYTIMRSQGVNPNVLDNIISTFRRTRKAD